MLTKQSECGAQRIFARIIFDQCVNFCFICSRYEEVVLWMDSVDAALRNILIEDSDVAQFEAEKARFVVSSLKFLNKSFICIYLVVVQVHGCKRTHELL